MRTAHEDSHLPDKDRDLEESLPHGIHRNQPRQQSDVGLLPSIATSFSVLDLLICEKFLEKNCPVLKFWNS